MLWEGRLNMGYLLLRSAKNTYAGVDWVRDQFTRAPIRSWKPIGGRTPIHCSSRAPSLLGNGPMRTDSVLSSREIRGAPSDPNL